MQTFPTTPVENPQTKAEILSELNKIFATLSETVNNMDEEEYNKPPHPEKWSAAGHHEHIMLSNAGSASALKQPPAFFARFGRLERTAFDYPAVVEAYQERSRQTTLRPSAKYAPVPGQPKTRQELMASWNMVQQKIVERLENWKEGDLDEAVFPHPALGLVNMREQLLFTIYHTYHHIDGMEKAAKGIYNL